MITTKTTTAMVAAIALLGAVAPAAFAQVTQTNTNTNTQTSTVTITGPISSGTGGTTAVGIGVSQEAGVCQLNVAADNDVTEAGAGDASSETELSGSIDGSDCS